jgi:hypothetical protein
MSTDNTENVTMSVNEQLSEVEAPVEAPVAATEVAAAPVNLTVGGLANVRRLLELAVERGAFKANEMTSVGRVYDEFVGGLNTLASQVQAAQPAAAAAPAEAETSTEPTTV